MTPSDNPEPWWREEGKSPPTLDQLQAKDNKYWGLGQHLRASERERIKWYIEELLPLELWFASRKTGRLPSDRCDTLALLLGYSVEPLLQAIGVWQPSRLVLLHSAQYGDQTGDARAESVCQWIEDSLLPAMGRNMDICRHPVDMAPDSVFRALCDTVLSDQQCGKQVVVDITGAKKSMDAGAFLFAAYAGIRVSYVDVEYDGRLRDPRPLGYTCCIGVLPNPYSAFRLRDWERVQHLYKHYQFREAYQTLSSGILPAMEGRFEDGQRGAAAKLSQLLGFYQAWDDGDHQQAYEQFCALRLILPDFRPPRVIKELGKVSPARPGRKAQGNNPNEAAKALLGMYAALEEPGRLFENNAMLLAYAHDELAKIKRLIEYQENNRSALVRAFGLDEFLQKTRLVRLWNRRLLCISQHSPDWSDGQVRGSLASYHGRMLDILQRKRSIELRRTDLTGSCKLHYPRDSSGPALESYWEQAAPCGAGLDPEKIRALRNKAVHMSLYVNRELSLAAWDYARAGLEEFEKNWVALGEGESPPCDSQDVECLTWSEALKLCGVDFLPLAFAQ